MNLRDKLRAVGGSRNGSGAEKPPKADAVRDCRHLLVRRPPEDFPGALSLRRETLELMSAVPLPEPFDPKRILYLDTETTGLGGSGTVAFLVGLGHLTEHGFEVHQYLMRDYPEEPYVLRHVAEELENFDLLCTFNGASFDLPLLESRFLMNRMNRSCLDLPHLDLLHLSRRLWKPRLGRCTLGRLEEMILGAPRREDLPGSEVPQRYFSFLRTGREELLQDILDHNAQDIASLCVLLSHMAALYEQPEQMSFSEDVYAMGRALEKEKHPERARRCYTLARRGRMGDAASAALAHSYRRAGNREEAVQVWREMIAAHRGGAGPYIELAKYEEHVRKDPAAALALTERAMALLSEETLPGQTGARSIGFPNKTVQETKNALQYRYQRLKRKLKEQ